MNVRIFIASAIIFISTGIAMANVLTSHEFAVDRLYRADSLQDFRGEQRNVWWDANYNELRLGAKANVRQYSDGSAARIYSGTYYSEPVRADFEFHELVPSWNFRLDEERQGYRVHIRVADANEHWSPWFYFGGAGVLSELDPERRPLKSEDWGEVDIDYLLLKKPALYFQYRVELESHAPDPPDGENRVALRRFFVSYSNTAGDEELWRRESNGDFSPRDWAKTIPVPYRSQRWVSDISLRGKICCPTSLAMALEAFGVDKPTLSVAREAYDAENGIYGTWPRAAQAAFRNGMDAWVQRFRSHETVKRAIAEGLPIMASIRVKTGELSNSQYRRTSGHLILIRGLTPEGDYVVNDPYSQGETGEESIFKKEDVEKIWFDKGGVGIVIRRGEPDSDSLNKG